MVSNARSRRSVHRCGLPILILGVFTGLAVSCKESGPPVVLQNDGARPVVVSRGPTRGQTPVAPGDARTYVFASEAKSIWIDGGTADSGLRITLTDGLRDPVIIVVTRGDLRLADPAPYRDNLLQIFIGLASKTQLARIEPEEIMTAVAEEARVFGKRVTLINGTDRVVRIDVALAANVLASADFEPGQNGPMPYVIGLDEFDRVDIADAGADRGYRIYFPQRLAGSVTFELPSEPLPTATIIPLDPRLCSLSSECSTAAKARKTPTPD